MSVWFRIVLVWLMALALPAQGLAAVTMLHCGQSHQRQHSAPAAMSDAAAHEHHAMAQAGATGSPGTLTADEGTQPEASSGPAPVGCSACAACCTAAAFASQGLVVAAPEAAPARFSVLVRSIEALASDGPDRPPRLVSP